MINKIRAYITGNIRYYLYYNPKLVWFMRNHIYFQIQARINSMDKQCYNDGSCKECGCRTTALQMANKACDGFCYPKMLNKKDWQFLNTDLKPFLGIKGILWTIENNKFVKL